MSYPTTPVFTTVNLKSESPTLVSESASGKLQARQIAGQRWSFSASYAPMTRSEFAPVSAFIMQQRGRLNTFTIELPIMSDSASSASGTLAANGAVAAGNTVITTDGLTGSLNVGDMVKFNGHDKVYMVVAVSGTNMTSMTVEPPLTDSVADNETIDYNNVLMSVRLNNDVQEFGLRTDSLVSYEVDFIEAI